MAQLGRQEPERVREPDRLFGSHVRSSSSWLHLLALVSLGKHKVPSEGCSWALIPGRGPLASHPGASKRVRGSEAVMGAPQGPGPAWGLLDPAGRKKSVHKRALGEEEHLSHLCTRKRRGGSS